VRVRRDAAVQMVAVSTIARISSSVYCCTPAESVSDSTPPVRIS